MAIFACAASALFFAALAAEVQGAPKTLKEGLKALEIGKTFEFEMDKPKDEKNKDSKEKTTPETAAASQKYTATLTATKYVGNDHILLDPDPIQSAIISFTAIPSGSPSGTKTLAGEARVMTPWKQDDVNKHLYVEPMALLDGAYVILWDNSIGTTGKPNKENLIIPSSSVRSNIADALFTLWLGSPTQKKTARVYSSEISWPHNSGKVTA